MKKGKLDGDSGVVPNGATVDPDITGQPEDNIIGSSDNDTDSQATIEDPATRADEMAPTTRHQWAQEIQSTKDEQSAKVKKPVQGQQPVKSQQPVKTQQPARNTKPPEPAKVKKPVKGQQPTRNQQPASSQQPAEGKQPAQNTKPLEKNQDQRPSVLDDPYLVSCSPKIDKAIGFPGGPTKENADEWLNKKIEFIQQQAQERMSKSWVQLKEAQDGVADMRKGVLPGSDEIPPHLLDFPDDEPSRRRTRAQRRMSQEARDKPVSPARKNQVVSVTQGNDDTGCPESIESPEPPSNEGVVQSNPKGRKMPKRRPRANELDTNLGVGWDFKKVTSRGRPSKSKD